MDDNAKQLAVSIDTHFQNWAELGIKAAKEGAEIPPRPDFQQILMMLDPSYNRTMENNNGYFTKQRFNHYY